MLGSLLNALHKFPKLVHGANFKIRSKVDVKYNCIAWAVVREDVWIDPNDFLDGTYWPPDVQKGMGLENLESFFNSYGYVRCDDFALEEGFMKVALYQNNNNWTHAARQLSKGVWASKMGQAEDIHHDTPSDLEGGAYGSIYLVMKRPNSSYISVIRKKR
jgi:hypothetical protein